MVMILPPSAMKINIRDWHPNSLPKLKKKCFSVRIGELKSRPIVNFVCQKSICSLLAISRFGSDAPLLNGTYVGYLANKRKIG